MKKIMLHVRKIEIKTNNRLINFLSRCAGVKRFTYNWGLGQIKKALEEGNKPLKINDLKKYFNSIKEKDFGFVYESPKDCNQQAFDNLKKAFSGFFKKTSKFPRFKKKGVRDSFYLSNDKTKISKTGRSLWIPLLGWVSLKEKFEYKQSRKENKLISVTISRTADKWFASISMEIPDEDAPALKIISNNIIALDAGLKTKLTNSDGTTVESPKNMKRVQDNLARKQRSFQRMRDNFKQQVKINPELNELVKTRYNNRNELKNVPNTKHNLNKMKDEIARVHARLANMRRDENHKISTQLCRENQTITIEDLDIKGMMEDSKNSGNNRSFADNAIGQLFEFLEYKSIKYGTNLIKAGQFYPSSKNCSGCGNHKSDLTLKDRIYECEVCGLSVDRDFNASLNLLKYGLSYLRLQEKLTYEKTNSIWLENLKNVKNTTAGLAGINAWGDLTMIDVARYHSQTDMKEPGNSRDLLIEVER